MHNNQHHQTKEQLMFSLLAVQEEVAARSSSEEEQQKVQQVVQNAQQQLQLARSQVARLQSGLGRGQPLELEVRTPCHTLIPLNILGHLILQESHLQQVYSLS